MWPLRGCTYIDRYVASLFFRPLSSNASSECVDIHRKPTLDWTFCLNGFLSGETFLLFDKRNTFSTGIVNIFLTTSGQEDLCTPRGRRTKWTSLLAQGRYTRNAYSCGTLLCSLSVLWPLFQSSLCLCHPVSYCLFLSIYLTNL